MGQRTRARQHSAQLVPRHALRTPHITHIRSHTLAPSVCWYTLRRAPSLYRHQQVVLRLEGLHPCLRPRPRCQPPTHHPTSFMTPVSEPMKSKEVDLLNTRLK